ncbi:MAG TPA: TetR/AcrR family transcriptional regulator [Acidimicrobiales bacterium]|nr:TetR/AcrR family transcriptional regulator [Acidimicrobiales bacterium]
MGEPLPEREPTGSWAGTARGRPRDPGLDTAIRAAAMELLEEVGYGRLTMERVARRAGVSKASLYLRWPNKLAVVTDALAHHARPVPEVPDTGSLPADMRAFLQGLLRAKDQAGRALAGVSSEIATNPALRRAWHLGMGGTLTGCLREIVTRAAQRGELPPDADLELLAQLPLSLLQNWRLEHGRVPGMEAVERIVHQFYTPRGLP